MPAAQKPDAPIFIVGHQRSGTTMLRLILNAHPQIVIPSEAHIVSLLRRVESKYGPMTDDRAFDQAIDRLVQKDRMREWGFDVETMRARCRQGERSPAGLFAAVMSLWTDQTGKPRWGEKTPGNYRFVRDLTTWFPDAQVIHIVRDARDVAVSCLTPPFSDRYDKGNEFEVALRWRDAVHRGRRAARALGPERYLEFRYEELTADPEALARKLCAFLREDFDPAMLEFHRSAEGKVSRGESTFHQRTKKEVNRKRVERWRTDASREFVMAVEGIAGREMTQLGYTLSGWSPPTGLRARILYERLRPRRLARFYKPPGGASPEPP